MSIVIGMVIGGLLILAGICIGVALTMVVVDNQKDSQKG